MAKRSFESHGAFFSDFVRQGTRVLDCGCGPGSITQGIAERAAPAGVIGVDFGESQILRAKNDAATRGIANLTFMAASCYNLPFEDGSFDCVFSHALLEHLAEPKKALSEFHRVLKRGGHLGVCSPDWGGFLLAPHSTALAAARDAYTELQNRNGGDVVVGRKLGVYLSETGFSSIQMNARYECYPTLNFIGEYLGRQLEQAGCAQEAATLKLWSESADGLFAQAWVSAVGKK